MNCTGKKAMKNKGSINNQRGGVVIGLLLLLILGVLLMATNPDEAKMRSKLHAGLSPADQVVTLGGRLNELLGAVKFAYTDYIVCSTLSIYEKNGEKELLAVGAAGQVFLVSKLESLKLERLKETVKEKLEATGLTQ